MARNAMRVCPVPSCPELVAGGGKCATHRAEAERARGTAAQRGYDEAHRALRRKLVPKVERGEFNCARCGLPILPGTPWHLDHRDDRSGYLGPSHQACNTAAPRLKP